LLNHQIRNDDKENDIEPFTDKHGHDAFHQDPGKGAHEGGGSRDEQFMPLLNPKVVITKPFTDEYGSGAPASAHETAGCNELCLVVRLRDVDDVLYAARQHLGLQTLNSDS
jgi:hypothetical protein